MRILTQDIIICNELKYMIETKPFLEHEKLPSERELATMLDVQRTTIRTGLKLLLQEGWIYAKKRSGYYVSAKRITKNVSRLASTSKMMLSLGREMKLRVVNIEKKEIGRELANHMKLPIGTKVFYIIRIREVEDEKVSVDLSYIPVALAPTLMDKDFSEKSLYDVLEKDYLIELDSSQQTITIEKAKGEVATYLDVDEGTYLAKQEGLVYSKDQEPVEYCVCYMKMNRFIYENS